MRDISVGVGRKLFRVVCRIVVVWGVWGVCGGMGMIRVGFIIEGWVIEKGKGKGKGMLGGQRAGRWRKELKDDNGPTGGRQS